MLFLIGGNDHPCRIIRIHIRQPVILSETDQVSVALEKIHLAFDFLLFLDADTRNIQFIAEGAGLGYDASCMNGRYASRLMVGTAIVDSQSC